MLDMSTNYAMLSNFITQHIFHLLYLLVQMMIHKYLLFRQIYTDRQTDAYMTNTDRKYQSNMLEHCRY